MVVRVPRGPAGLAQSECWREKWGKKWVCVGIVEPEAVCSFIPKHLFNLLLGVASDWLSRRGQVA